MKKKLRKEMLELRNNLDKDVCLNNSKIIISKVIEYLNIHNYKNILIYMDMQNEAMASLLLDEDYSIYITKTMPDNTLKINKYDKTKMVKHSFGYYESSDTNYIDGNVLDAIIIPGVAFDYYGNRVGFGKGYYDRLIEKYPNLPRIAICHDFQLNDKMIETDEHDKKMDLIITEKQTLSFI